MSNNSKKSKPSGNGLVGKTVEFGNFKAVITPKLSARIEARAGWAIEFGNKFSMGGHILHMIEHGEDEKQKEILENVTKILFIMTTLTPDGVYYKELMDVFERYNQRMVDAEKEKEANEGKTEEEIIEELKKRNQLVEQLNK